jgi:hypothetical protein
VYGRHLLKRVVYPEFEPMESLLRPDTDVSSNSVLTRHKDCPLGVFEDPAHDLDLARRCLDLYVARTVKHNKSDDQIRVSFAKDKPEL